MEAQAPFPLELFYCYARTDKADRDELEQHLAGLKRKYRITSWSDQEIVPGMAWEKEIAAHLNTADVILLLVSARFMASNYCYSVEMERALARHEEGTALVIPILLHPVYLEDAPFEKLQMLPTDAKPISKWTNRDEAFWDVTSGIAEALAKLIKEWPSKEEWINKGYALSDLNRFEEALVAFEHALRLDLDNADHWYNKGYALYGLNRFKEALIAYEHALRLDPSYRLAWNNKGNTLRYLKRNEEALIAYEHALRLDSSYVYAWNGKGNTLHDLKRNEEALIAYEHALRLDSSYVYGWNGKGNELYELKRFEEALVAFEHALHLDPDDEDSKEMMRIVLEELGRAR